MLEKNAEIVSFCYELDGSPYEGENILHIAIARIAVYVSISLTG